MSTFLTINGTSRHEPQIDEWFDSRHQDLATIARRWFAEMRGCGNDVSEVLHDGHPTVCVAHGALGYVSVFISHLNIGFFHGAFLEDPAKLLQGTERFMRHVKAKPGALPDSMPLRALIHAAYADIKVRFAAE